MSLERTSTSPFPAELVSVASGGNRLNLPPEVVDFLYRKQILAESAKKYDNFSGSIRSVRDYIRSEYDNDGINNPPHVYRNYGEPNPKVDPSGYYVYVDDPHGTYLPHSSDAIIRGQQLKVEDTEISGTHWIEGHHYNTDAEGNTILDKEGQPVPLGDFIMGPDGPETVVTFLFYERPDGHWERTQDHVGGQVNIPQTADVFFENAAISA